MLPGGVRRRAPALARTGSRGPRRAGRGDDGWTGVLRPPLGIEERGTGPWPRRSLPIMADESDNLTLVQLRRMDAKLDRIIAELGSQGRRITNFEVKVAHGLADMSASLAEVSVRLDGYGDRLDRIERRLDLVDVAPDR